MALATKAWINAARLRRKWERRRLSGRGALPLRERHFDWISEQVRGRSFADIGGLYEVSGDVALFAASCGAADVTLCDWGDAYLTEFPEKLVRQGSEIRFVQGDLEDPVTIERIGPHDIVYCSGVIYHSPNPVRQLMHLRELTRGLLYLGTYTIPEVPGIEQACVYYPYLGADAHAAYGSHHHDPEALLGIGAPFDDRPMHGYGNCWWGMTPSALQAMLRTARFDVVEIIDQDRSPFWTELVARPNSKDPLLSPISWPREWGEARIRGEQPPPFEDYYEQQRTGPTRD